MQSTETPVDHQTPTTALARMVAEHPLEREEHELLLAHVLAHVACAEGRTPTLDERAFIDRFTPQVDTPIDALADKDLPQDGLEDLNEDRREMIMALALVVAMLDARRGVTTEVIQRIAAAIELPLKRLASAERVAREYIVEQRFARLYAHGAPADAERKDAFASLRAIGASDSLLMAWDERYSMVAAARAVDEGERGAPTDKRRQGNFMARHDPTSKAHRAPSSVGVFGSA